MGFDTAAIGQGTAASGRGTAASGQGTVESGQGTAGYFGTVLVVVEGRGVAACHGRLVYSGTAVPKAAATLALVGTVAADVRTYQHINKVRFSITRQQQFQAHSQI